MRIKNKQTSESIGLALVFQSLLLAFYADIKAINWGLTYGNYFEDGTMSILYPLIFAGVIISWFLNKKTEKSINKWSVTIFLFLILFYILTYQFVGEPRVRIELFISLTLLALIIPHVVRINPQITLKAAMLFPAFSVFKLRQTFFFALSWQDSISMDSSYAYLIPISATIVYLRCYFKNEPLAQKTITIFLAIINFIFFTQLLQYGSRGPLTCILLLIAFLWVTEVNDKGLSFKRWKLGVATIAIVIIAITFLGTMKQLDNVLTENDANFRFVNKMMDLAAENNLSNGRDKLNQITLDGILERPILGHGLDRYEANTGQIYPHNFILQILYDGGLFFFLLLIPIAVKKIFEKFKNADKNDYAIYSFLLFASVPGAFFSQDLWNLSILWLFFGSVISNQFVSNTKNG